MRYILIFGISLVLQSCFLFTGKVPPKVKVDQLPEFLATPSLYEIQGRNVDEASGIAASQSMKGNLWVIQDSNTEPGLHLLSGQGAYLGFLSLPIENRDWEDLGLSNGPEAGKKYIYIPDTGDNNNVYKESFIYRLEEPKSLNEPAPKLDKISFSYEKDETLDVEAMFVDPVTKDIYLISKFPLFSVRVYRIAYPYSTTEINIAKFMGTIPHAYITAADMSQDGKQLMIKNLDAIYYWQLKENETPFEALSRSRDIGLPYYIERQGEGLCFDYKDSGYYTLSENGFQSGNIFMQYYQRKLTE